MQLSEESGKIIKLILPKLKECMTYRIEDKNKNKLFKKSLNKMLTVLYNDILAGNNYVKHQLASDCMAASLKMLGPANKGPNKPEIYSSRFFPENIRKYIEETGKYQLTYQCSIKGRKITIYFTLFSEDDLTSLEKYDNYAHMMYTWLYICDLYSFKKCANTLSIYVYQTPFKKNLPEKTTTTLGTSHVNTAFTLNCAVNGEMVLFREEEWMKVFIHETFHSYGLDFGTYTAISIKSYVRNIFPIDSDFNIEGANN